MLPRCIPIRSSYPPLPGAIASKELAQKHEHGYTREQNDPTEEGPEESEDDDEDDDVNKLAPTRRSRVRRLPARASYQRETIYSILDAAVLTHIGYLTEVRRKKPGVQSLK